jgi:hypothetical protein
MPHTKPFQLKMKTVLENGWYMEVKESNFIVTVVLNIASGRMV